MDKRVRKNGKIELWRFLFCIIIMLFHIGDDIFGRDFRIIGELSLFSKGWFAVEFFFVVSGFLMASSAFKNRANGLSTGRDTFNFMQRKVMAVLPYHIIVFFVTLVGVSFMGDGGISGLFGRFFRALPNFLLISRSGLSSSDILGVEWYIADMLIVMLILYPVCRRYYDAFTKIVAPVGAIMIIGYLVKTTGSLSGSTSWSVIVSKTFLRAFSEICAGAFAFELCRNMKKLKFSKGDKLFLSLIEIVSYGLVIAFIVAGNFPEKYCGTVFIFVCIAVCLSFSGLTFGGRLFDNKAVYFLGSISLPLYLWQSLIRRIARSDMFEMSSWGRVVLFFVATFALTFAIMPVEKRLRRAINKKLVEIGIIK